MVRFIYTHHFTLAFLVRVVFYVLFYDLFTKEEIDRILLVRFGFFHEFFCSFLIQAFREDERDERLAGPNRNFSII